MDEDFNINDLSKSVKDENSPYWLDNFKKRHLKEKSHSKVEEACLDQKNLENEETNFIEISFNETRLKDDIMSMEAPLFSIKKKDMAVRSWATADGTKRVTITPSGIGCATMYDKDIIIYAISCLIDRLNHGLPISKVIRFHPHNYFKATLQGVSGREYKNLEKGLDRLNGTSYKTNIRTNKIEAIEAFTLVEKYKFIKSSKKCEDFVEVTLCDWLINAVEGKNILTIDKNYFKLSSPFQKRLYEIGRKHVGNKPSWKLSIDLLMSRIGCFCETKEFNRHLRKARESEHLLGYRFNTVGKFVEFTQNDPNKLLPSKRID